LADLDRLDDADELLHVDLAGRDPDEGMTQVPYEKGALLLQHLEEQAGRARFDEFLRGYFDHFAFRSITTADFVAYVREHLAGGDPPAGTPVRLEAWIDRPGLPADAPRPASDAFGAVERQLAAWTDGSRRAGEIETGSWTTQEWLHFLNAASGDLSAERMAELDDAFGLTGSGNAEIAHQWLLAAVRAGYGRADDRLERYLLGIGRRKLIAPLYEALAAAPGGRERALAIYRRARPGYHPISVDAIDAILGWNERSPG
ncbi:MAG: leukotriene A4 hydrolase C-terminal domain-containing protein, partial [Acidobacteria bacterium]|nr:leukotriene A4 hydrolase C-terminal domain-containing protein [Acidobacteriota bacterium]